jgi:hypothetical protein
VSTLRSAVDELLTADDRVLGDEQLVSDLDEVEHATRQLEVVRARRLAEIERRGSFAIDGHVSVTSWIAARHRVSYSAAGAQVRLARALESMPATAEAFASGEVSSSAVGLLVSAREACPEEFTRSEETLVDAARTLPVAELRGAVAYWREAAEAEGSHDDERQELFVSPTMSGRGRLNGDLNADTTQTVITALRAAEDAQVRSGDGSDARTPAQRRADALGEICRQWLDGADRPVVAGERPHVVITMDLAALEGRLGERCQLEDVGRITAETARQWACDSNVTRVITDGASQPLDVGRKTKVVPLALRRALAIRDGGCAFPACNRPPSWCDAHHVRHWADGGETALDNLVLLCRRHHRLIHHRKFRIEIVDDRPAFHRPDGTILEADRAPP